MSGRDRSNRTPDNASSARVSKGDMCRFPVDSPDPRLSYIKLATPREARRYGRLEKYSRVDPPDPWMNTTAGHGPVPFGVITVPASFTVSLVKTTCSRSYTSRLTATRMALPPCFQRSFLARPALSRSETTTVTSDG